VTPLLLAALLALGAAPVADARTAGNERLLARMAAERGLTAAQVERLRAVFAGSRRIGQGNPALSVHPQSEAQCAAALAVRPLPFAADPRFEALCGGKQMAPLYDPRTQTPAQARACIDTFEYPDLPCAFPVVWVRPSEAALLCEAEGKRLCDAHEWEGACAGALEPPDYRFDLAQGVPWREAPARMRAAHNRAHAASKGWSYGPAPRRGVCATEGAKTPGCEGGEYRGCGSNTFPAGSHPECRSALGVYDLNGNAAEEMNLPLAPEEQASLAREGGESGPLGVTELKGSWFVFDRTPAHPDWCRWRAPFWHGTRTRAADSHANYHLGFRCCKTVPAPPGTPPAPPPAGSPPRR
jgi:hypothetical protein